MSQTTPLPPGPGPAAGGIFISYRRGIDNDSAGRLFDRLAAVFPESRIFRDVDSALELLGLDFHQVLTDRVQGCAVLVAVIGRGWIDAIPRLEAEADFVRIELAAALARPDLRLIPVLVGDVDMPRAEALPEVLRPLVRRGAIRLTNEGYSKAVETVIRAIAQVVEGPGTVPARQPEAAAPLAPPTAPQETPRLARVSPGAAGRGPVGPGPVHLWMRRLALLTTLVTGLTWAGANLLLWQQARGMAGDIDTMMPREAPDLLRPPAGTEAP